MKITKLLFMAIASSFVFVSCSGDDENASNVPLGTYDNGVLVLNEGNASAGTVSFFDNDLVTVSQNVFNAENPGEGLGGYVQSIFFDDEKAFIISNGSNKITVVNRYTFKLIAKIEAGFDIPRYGVVENGKAYVTNLATFSSLTDDFVSVINLSTMVVESTIPINAIAERIEEENGKLYISNGSFGDGNSITVVNTVTSTVEATINVGISPTSIEEEAGFLYVLCGNYLDNSKLVKINLATNQIASEIVMEGVINAQNLNIEDNKIYFTVNSDVFVENLSATTISSTPKFTSAATYLYGFGVDGGRIFVADAKNFASDGEVFIYNNAGILQKQFTVGLNPNGFYFND
jgi:YVTN family beta-propeller protein